MPEVREADALDDALVAEVLAAAFIEDPVMAYIFPDVQIRRARSQAMFSAMCRSDRTAGSCYIAKGGEAASTWRDAGRTRLSRAEIASQACSWVSASRTALGRALTFSAACEAHQPNLPYRYLHLVGCLPSRRREGFGSAVVEAGLMRCDADGTAAYLETGNHDNLAFYASLGFRVVGDWKVGSTLRCWSLLRPVSPRRSVHLGATMRGAA